MNDHSTEAIVTHPTTAFTVWSCPCGSGCPCLCTCPNGTWLLAVDAWCGKLRAGQNGHPEEMTT